MLLYRRIKVGIVRYLKLHNSRVPLTIPPSYIRVRAVVWKCGEGQSDRHINTQTAVANIYFASATPHAKFNKEKN